MGDINKAAKEYGEKNPNLTMCDGEYVKDYETPALDFIEGVNWFKNNCWVDAQGDNLPEIDREVVVLIQDYEDYPEHLRVGFGHRPNPDGWDGKDIVTGKITHYEPELYDEAGWNGPDIKYWLDVKLPNEK